MKHFFTFLGILIFSPFIFSCNDISDADATLNKAEVYMEEHPEHALEILESIEQTKLTTRKSRAKYALLYSMALDKNYIDVTSDTIIAPAVNYYKNHGTAKEKFATLYYYGRVHQNAGHIDKAMAEFVEAEQMISSQIDNGLIARLYKAKMVAYQNVFDYKSAAIQAELAANYFLSSSDTTKYINTIRDLAILYSQLGDTGSQEKYINILESNIHLMDEYQLNGYYAVLLNSSLGGSTDKINKSLLEYLTAISDESIIYWLCVSNAYIELNDYQSAMMALDKYIYFGGLLDPKFYWTAATLYECIGEFNRALAYYKEYQQVTDSIDMSIFKSDTKFIEERYKAEIESLRQSFYIVIVTLSCTLISLILIILAYRFKRMKEAKLKQKIEFDHERKLMAEEKEQVEVQCTLLKEEQEEAKRMYLSLKAEVEQLKKIKKDKTIDKDIIASVEQRLNILNMFILAELSDSFEKIAYNELGKLMENREEFMESTKQTFMISRPKFIEYLRKNNLSDWEIGCCCLYCIGFNGAEISEYLKRKAIYNANSVIRQKLNIPKGKSQIDVFLKQKMQEYTLV